LINNRQSGRRRGRGGGAPRPNGSGNGPDRGNRIDNRSRGNAAQLLEKYKALARDAQMQGDRVNTEYYLQFADHYFRVLAENRARFDEQRPRRDDHLPNDYHAQGEAQGYDQDDFADESDLNGNVDDRGGRQERFERQPRFERQDHNERAERPERSQPRERFEATARERPEQAAREDRPFGDSREPRARNGEASRVLSSGNEDGGAGAPVPVTEAQQAETPAAERPRRGRRPRVQAASEAAEERIEMDRLPPAFGADGSLLAGGGESAASAEEKPRRRVRRPRSDAVTADI
jgi:hypothetical protein